MEQDITQEAINPETGITKIKSNINLRALEEKSNPVPQIDMSSFSRKMTVQSASAGITLGQNLGIDLDDYTKYTGEQINPFIQDLDAMRSGEQGAGELLRKGVGNFLNTGIGEILKMPGYLYGLGDGLATGWSEGNWFDVSAALDNVWLNTINEAQEDIREKYLQIYQNKLAEESLGAALSNPEFWASDFADGLGFFASMMLPGAAITKIGGGVGLAATRKLLAAGTANSKRIIKALGGAAGAENKINVGLSTLVNTTFEAAAEASNFRDNMKSQYDKFLQPDGTYQMPNGDKLTKEQVDGIIGDNVANVYNSNLALLVLPNMVVNNALFGKLANKSWYKEFGTTIKGMKEGMDQGALTIARKTAGQIAKNAAWEGLGEEGGQMAVENLYTQRALGDKDNDIISQYLDTITSIEGLKAAFTGAMLGGLGGGYQTYRENKEKAENINKFKEKLKNSIGHMEGSASIFETKDGKVDLNVENIRKQFETNMKFAFAYNQLKEGLETENPKQIREAWDEIFVNFAMDYVKMEGGYELLQSHFEELAETFLMGVNSYINDQIVGKNKTKVKQDVENMKKNLFERAKVLNDAYQDIQFLGGAKFLGINDKLFESVEDKDMAKTLAPFFTENMEERVMVTANSIYSLEKEIEEVDQQIAEQSKKKSVTASKVVDSLVESKQALEQNLEQEKKEYEKLFDAKEQQKQFKEFVKETNKRKEADLKVKNHKDNLENRFIPAIKAALLNKGYTLAKSAKRFFKSGMYFKGKDGEVYRVTRSQDRTKQELLNVQTGERIPFDVEVALEMGLENPKYIVSAEEGLKLEQQLKKQKKVNASDQLGDDGQGEQKGSEEEDAKSDVAGKINIFSTITNHVNKDGTPRPAGVRWSNWFSKRRAEGDVEIVVFNREDMEQLSSVPNNELKASPTGDELYAVVMYKGQIAVDNNGMAIFAGIAKPGTPQLNLVRYAELTLGITLPKEGKKVEYKGNQYNTQQLLNFIKKEITEEYTKWRNSLKSGDKFSADRISHGIGVKNEKGIRQKASKVFQVKRVVIPREDTWNGISVRKGYAYIETVDGNLVSVGSNRISELKNSEEIITKILKLVGLANTLNTLKDEIVVEGGGVTHLATMKNNPGLLNQFIRMGKSRINPRFGEPMDLYISGSKKGERTINFISPEGKTITYPISEIINNKGEIQKTAALEDIKRIIGDKFANSDLATLDAASTKKQFNLFEDVDFATGRVKLKKIRQSYSTYLADNYLTSGYVTDSGLPNFVNHYVELNRESKENVRDRFEELTNDVPPLVVIKEEEKILTFTEMVSSQKDNIQIGKIENGIVYLEHPETGELIAFASYTDPEFNTYTMVDGKVSMADNSSQILLHKFNQKLLELVENEPPPPPSELEEVKAITVGEPHTLVVETADEVQYYFITPEELGGMYMFVPSNTGPISEGLSRMFTTDNKVTTLAAEIKGAGLGVQKVTMFKNTASVEDITSLVPKNKTLRQC